MYRPIVYLMYYQADNEYGVHYYIKSQKKIVGRFKSIIDARFARGIIYEEAE